MHAYIYPHRCTHLAPVQAEKPSQVSYAPIALVVEVIHDVGISMHAYIYIIDAHISLLYKQKGQAKCLVHQLLKL